MVEISKEFPIPLVVTKTDSLEGLHAWKSLCLRNWEAQFIFVRFLLYIYFVGDLQILGDFVLFQGQFETGGWIYLYSDGINNPQC